MSNALKTLAGSAVAAAGLAALPASAMDVLARVISSTPVVQQVAVQREVCNNQTVVTQAPRSGAGALLGAVAGGAAGNAIGHGGGRAAATVIGLIGGAMVGDRIEGPNSQLQNVQQCGTQTFYENRPTHFNVVYEYQSSQYSAQMAYDPGSYVRLQMTPAGALPAQSSPEQAYQYPSGQPLQATPAQPQAYYQPQPAVAFVQQPVYVQQVAQPIYYAQPYYAQPYYSPFIAPIGLSLNLGYSRGFGGGHHRRWR